MTLFLSSHKTGIRVPYHGYLIALNSEIPHENSRTVQESENLVLDVESSSSGR